MSGQKETPRQKMISMMYLVLTALLALNVSKEVLNAFIVVNESVERTNYSFHQKISDTYGDFEKKYQVNQSEVLPFWEKALHAQKLSREMIAYVEEMKIDLIAFTESIEPDSARNVDMKSLSRLDDNIRTTNFLMGPSETGEDGKAGELKQKIEEFKTEMLKLLNDGDRPDFRTGLQTDVDFINHEGKKLNWETHHFYDTILAADLTLLSKLITEILTFEFDVVNYLINAISANDFKYDKIAAKILPRSDFIFEGESYDAEIIVAAYDTTKSPEVYILKGTDSLAVDELYKSQKIENGPGSTKLKFTNNRLGTNNYAGIVRVKNGSGQYSNYHFNGRYTVSKPNLTVSATKMNVLYAGVDNPVSISASGIPRNKLIPTISTGTIRIDPNSSGWIVNVPANNNEATLLVQAEVDGKIRRMGSNRFRIKHLPTPRAVIANHDRGLIDREILIAAGALVTRLPDDFEFDYPFSIVSFRLSMQRGLRNYEYKSSSNQLSDEMKKQLRRTNRGQKIVFDNISAVGPNDRKVNLQPIMLTIN